MKMWCFPIFSSHRQDRSVGFPYQGPELIHSKKKSDSPLFFLAWKGEEKNVRCRPGLLATVFSNVLNYYILLERISWALRSYPAPLSPALHFVKLNLSDPQIEKERLSSALFFTLRVQICPDLAKFHFQYEINDQYLLSDLSPHRHMSKISFINKEYAHKQG